MKENKIKILGSFIIIGILVIMMLASFLFEYGPSFVQFFNINNQKINEFLQIQNPVSRLDYSKIYPLENNQLNKVVKKNIVTKYLNRVAKFSKRLEDATSKSLYGYEKMVETSYLYDKLIFYNIKSNNDTNAKINLGNDYITTTRPKEDVTNYANVLIDFKNYLASLDIDFLYVQAPFKISENESLSKIYNDYTNDNMNRLLKLIDKKVDYLDLRENIKLANLDHLSLFFKTDNHWKPETGLFAAKAISKYLNSNYNLNLESENIIEDKFNYQVYPKMYLGSYGRQVSLANAKPEDFTLITPKFTTKLNIKIPEKNLDKTGTYQETLIDNTKIKYQNFYSISQYSAYMHGDCQLIEIHNQEVHNGKKILWIKDSFSDVVTGFLALENEYLAIIDLRHFNGSLKSYLQKYQPDMVVVMYNGGVVTSNLESSKNDYLWTNLNK